MQMFKLLDPLLSYEAISIWKKKKIKEENAQENESEI